MISKLERKFRQLNSNYQKEVLDFVEFLSNKNFNTSKSVQKNKNLIILKKPKYLKASKYCGILKLKSDPMKIQKNLRNEWK